MIDLRYHIYSLAAVFFALAIGIVIGTSFARGTSPSSTERSTIARYENSMHVLRREIEMAADDSAQKADMASKSEEFCRAVLPTIAKDRLAWRNVAIVQTGDYDDLSGNVKLALELAGARASSVTDISRTFPFENHQKVSTVLISCGFAPPDNAKEARDMLFGLLARTVTSPNHQNLISKMEQAGLGKFTGDYNKSSHMIVLVGGAESKTTDLGSLVDSQLIAQLEAPGVIIVGCEGRQASKSYVPEWQKMGVATIDNVDSAIGQMALICALNGEKAQFGVKDTADRLIPQTLEIK
ncbi:MAG: copper transporter [Armatimonadota bacterium]|nr:copper transporter [bacterium]